MQFLLDPRLQRSAKIAFWLALAFAFTMAVLPKPPETPIDRFGDKFAHIVAFFTLSILGGVAFGRELRWRLIERLVFFGAVIEVIQTVPALHRTADLRDWIADGVAVLVGTMLASWLVPARIRHDP
jgi:VanZ family protein